MWVTTKKQYENSLMFFNFQEKNDLCTFKFSNMKKLYSKQIEESSIPSLYSVSIQGVYINSTNVFQLKSILIKLLLKLNMYLNL